MFTTTWIPPQLRFWTAFISNLLATVLLVGATALVAIVIRNKMTVDDIGDCLVCRYRPLGLLTSADDFNSHSRYTGAALGLLTFLAFTTHELLLRHHEDGAATAGGKRLRALVRPLTYVCFYKIWLVFGAVTVTLTTVTISMLLGARLRRGYLTSGISLPFEALNETLLYAGPLANMSHVRYDVRKVDAMRAGNPFIRYDHLYPNDTLEIPGNMKKAAWYLEQDHIRELESFMYRSAMIHTSTKTRRLQFLPANLTQLVDQKGFQLGGSVYPSMCTKGIGIIMTTYERFAGDGMPGLPRRFTFSHMIGETYSNIVNVNCRDIRQHYVITDETVFVGQSTSGTAGRRSWNLTHMSIAQRDGPQFYDIRRDPSRTQIVTDFGLLHSSRMTTTDGSKITQHEGSFLAPTQTIIIPNWNPYRPTALMLECHYLPSEHTEAFIVQGPNGRIMSAPRNLVTMPTNELKLAPFTDGHGGKCLSPILALPAARGIHELLQGTDSLLSKAFQDLSYQPQSESSLCPILEQVLGETAQAYFSLLRQRVERGNMWPQNEQLGHPDKKDYHMWFDIMRYGGAVAYPWARFAVCIFLALSTGVAFVRTCVVDCLTPFSATTVCRSLPTDAVAVLEKKGEMSGKGG